MDFIQAYMRRTPLRSGVSGDDDLDRKRAERERKKEEAKKARAGFVFEIVKKWAPVFDVPPATVMSIMNIESAFNPKKVNEDRKDKGFAWGLGQQMADEAEYKVGKIRKDYLKDFPQLKVVLSRYRGNPKDLLDPELNTVLTCWQLGLLTKEFGDFPTVAAAYHQGAGAVRQRLNAGKPAVSSKQPKGMLYVTMAVNARNQSISYVPDMLAYVD